MGRDLLKTISQLRMYTIKECKMAEWVDGWTRGVLPLRRKIRFPGRRGLGCPGGESVHLDPLLRRTGRVRSKGLRVLRLLGPKIDETGPGAADRESRELVCDRGDRAFPRGMTELLVADHFGQEGDEIGRLDHGPAVLTVPQGRKRRLPGDVDVPSACGTGVIGRDSRLSHLVDEVIHVHVHLGHDLSSTE